jgi:branched-chain amino acid transport system permease protein
VLNFVVEKIAYRPLRNAPRLAPLITAMGMSLLLQTLAMMIWKPNPKPFPPLLPTDVFFLWADGPVITVTQILILGTTVAVLAGSCGWSTRPSWAARCAPRPRTRGWPA